MSRAERAWIWIAVIVAAGIVAIAPFTGSTGMCLDAGEGNPDASHCTSGPALGWPVSWTIAVICAAVAAYAAYRLIRTLRRRPT
ncbi:hypothetical protein L2X99_02310 [Microbacterium sp. KUDC0406]|uniref:hypothetical protein n=1 Tax=Microbacterium sp. KUDC0406 TaxID=2909588 RepID=UPI001F239253|nr:hypothetical protein [Microbacterium sp. KUDC0406]UJP10540.1 hypothetical protein L2X99_02310 [Microbacterium sp. KUDC0406]